MIKKDILCSIDQNLRQQAPSMSNIGLLHGKMGISIFYYYLSSYTQDESHKHFADQLLDELYEAINKSSLSTDFETGLAGIAWGIEHLVQNGFVEADTDQILADLDYKIYNHLTFEGSISFGITNGLLGYAAYVLSRLVTKNLNSANDHTFILKRLLIEIVNKLYIAFEDMKGGFVEPPLFNILWNLPLSLITLSEIRKLDIYNKKIDSIFKSISPTLLSTLPVLECNKLYLLLGLESVLQQVSIGSWQQRAHLIRQQIDLNLLVKEFKDKSVTLNNGLAGIAFIIENLQQISPSRYAELQLDKVYHKMTHSSFWDAFIVEDNEQKMNLGLLHGLSGIGLQIYKSSLNKVIS